MKRILTCILLIFVLCMLVLFSWCGRHGVSKTPSSTKTETGSTVTTEQTTSETGIKENADGTSTKKSRIRFNRRYNKKKHRGRH